MLVYCQSKRRYTGGNFLHLMADCIDDYNIPHHNIHLFLRDAGSSMIQATDLLEVGCDGQYEGGLPRQVRKRTHRKDKENDSQDSQVIKGSCIAQIFQEEESPPTRVLKKCSDVRWSSMYLICWSASWTTDMPFISSWLIITNTCASLMMTGMSLTYSWRSLSYFTNECTKRKKVSEHKSYNLWNNMTFLMFQGHQLHTRARRFNLNNSFFIFRTAKKVGEWRIFLGNQKRF